MKTKLTLEHFRKSVADLHERGSKLHEEIKTFLKERLKGTDEDNPQKVDITIEVKGGPDGSMALETIYIVGLFYNEEYDSIDFWEKDADMPHELDWLNLNEQLIVIENLCK